MHPGGKRAARLLDQYVGLNDGPREARGILFRILREEGWADSADEAHEAAERYEDSFLRGARDTCSDFAKLGRHCKFAFNSSSPDQIQGAAFVEPYDDDKIKAEKENRRRSADYVVFLNELSADDFELLCGGLISLLKVRDPIITRRSKDEGIDFYGKLELKNLLGVSSLPGGVEAQLDVWLVGQAKHYKKAPISTDAIRELVGSVALARSGAISSVTTPHPELNVRPCDPVFQLFVTTAPLSADCWRLIQMSGVIGMDGEMVALTLADNSIGITDDKFSTDKFTAWLNSFRSA